jgi:hypothetical protein
VSNSSSASFIVNLKLPKGKLYKFLVDNVDKNFSIYGIKEELSERIAHFEKQQKDYLERKKEAEDSGNLDKFFGLDWSNMLQKLNFNLSEIDRIFSEMANESDPFKLENLEIEYLGVASSVNHMSLRPMFEGEDNDVWRFTTYVTMFNDLDDVPEAMKNIILACNFNGVKVTCEVDED